jgi:(p)ppGpp synthase/HD superfamily hydrolase
MTFNLERALRSAASFHRGQERKGSGVPYVQHVVAVAMILDRLGFAEDVVIAGLLHDVVEDTEATLEQVREAFGETVAETVAFCSERKTDPGGQKRPWIDRKQEHLDLLIDAPIAARAVTLADKLHNLLSIQLDLREGRDVWSTFNAERSQVLWYYRSVIERCGTEDSRLATLTAECLEALQSLEGL